MHKKNSAASCPLTWWRKSAATRRRLYQNIPNKNNMGGCATVSRMSQNNQFTFFFFFFFSDYRLLFWYQFLAHQTTSIFFAPGPPQFATEFPSLVAHRVADGAGELHESHQRPELLRLAARLVGGQPFEKPTASASGSQGGMFFWMFGRTTIQKCELYIIQLYNTVWFLQNMYFSHEP